MNESYRNEWINETEVKWKKKELEKEWMNGREG